MKKFYLYLFFIFSILVSLFFFKNNETMGVNWTFPYFSGAANIDTSFEWNISPEDFEIVKNINSEDYYSYKHLKTEQTVEYTYGNLGYVLVAYLSRFFFGMFGDVNSILIFQLLIHFLISIFVIEKVLLSNVNRYAFVLLYASNPLVIHFVTFPFYYFWMVLPSVSLLLFDSYKDKIPRYLFFVTIVLLFSTFIRPTTIFLSFGLYVLVIFYANKMVDKKTAVAYFFIFVVGTILMSKNSGQGPWHTMYVGIGAYSNSYEIGELSDHEAYDYYNSTTGIQMSSDPISGTFVNKDKYLKYTNKIKERYLYIVKSDPLLIARNSLFNFPQVYSIGYIVDSKLLTFVSSLIGVLMILLFIYTKEYVVLFGVFLSALSFFWYFPAIPAYNFAAYIMLVVGFIRSLNFLWRGKFKQRRFYF
jgi:hypothetical protein